MALIGLRGGYLSTGEPPLNLPPVWHAPLRQALTESAARASRALIAQSVSGGLLVVASQPAPGSAGLFWVGYLIPPPHYWRFWMTIVTLLAVATAILVSFAVWAVISFNRSVEAQERLGRELAQKERLAALGRVVAGVAHEVRNPLASIKLRLDLAAAGADLPPSASQAIIHASTEISRLDRLVADLLVVAGRQIGPRTRTALGALVRSRADALAPWAATRKVSFALEGDATAVIDAEKVGRAVDNLLRNAVEAAPSGSQVLLTVDATTDAFRIRVEDLGDGIPNRSELFEPFFTTKADGTGLGLAISRAIARSHGGDVTYARIERQDGRSDGTDAATPHRVLTRFELTLSRHTDQPAQGLS